MLSADPFQTQTALLRRLNDPRDAKSWAEFCELYHPLVLRFARARGLNADDATDVTQELLGLRLRPAMAKFQLDHTRGRFRTWLWQVTQNAVRERLRRDAAERRGKEEFDRAHRDDAVDPVDEQLSREWEQAHRRRVLEFALSRTRASARPKTWACFEKQCLKGQSGADVARELGISVESVFTNAHRITARVRELCWQYDEDFADTDRRSAEDAASSNEDVPR